MPNKSGRFSDDNWTKRVLREGEKDSSIAHEAKIPGSLKEDPYYSEEFGISYTAIALQWLMQAGIDPFGEGYDSVPLAAKGILIAEAVNLAAKYIDPVFYDLKPLIFVEVACFGANKGVEVLYRDDDGTWDLSHKSIGSISFHDPHYEIENAIRGKPVTFSEHYNWSGIIRQDRAFEFLQSKEAVEEIAAATKPQFLDPLISRAETNGHTNSNGFYSLLPEAFLEKLGIKRESAERNRY